MRQRSAARREQFVAAAAELFEAQGYEETTTRAIAARVGVAETVLFRHFPSKRDLFVEVVRARGPAWLFRPDIPALLALGWPESLRSLAQEYLDTTRQHRVWLRLVFIEAARDPVVAAEARGQYAAVGEALRAVLAAGVAAGATRADLVPDALRIISLAVRGFLARAARQEFDDATWRRESAGFVDSLLRIVDAGLRPATEEAP